MQDEIILTTTTKENLISEILEGVQNLLSESREKDLLRNEWLTAKEVQSILKITPTTLWNYDQRGITTPQKIGSRKRYHKYQIVNLLSQRESKRK